MTGRTRFRRPQALWLSHRLWRRRLVFWGGAVAVGFVSVGFAAASVLAQKQFDHLIGYSKWLSLLVTPIGFVVCAWACRTYFPGAQGSGIPQAIAARYLRDTVSRERLLSPKLIVGKVILTLFGLACGASIGREGPTVQVGASIMLRAARWGRLGRERGLILAGSAAGVAAAFNTPLAGIVFAIEEMGRSYEHRTNGLILSTVILAGIAAFGLSGSYTYFGQTAVSLQHVVDWVAVLACGISGGAVGGVFSRLVIVGSDEIRRRLLNAGPKAPHIVALVCGVAVAIMGLISGGAIFGTGYDQARHALEGIPLPRSYAPLKLLATLCSTLSGIPGGIFAPSLSVGAGIGSLLTPYFPEAGAGAIVALGMAGYFSGVVQAPITAFVIITEMTADHSMVIPLMAASVLGYGTSRLICPTPLYHTLAEHFIEEGRAILAETPYSSADDDDMSRDEK